MTFVEVVEESVLASQAVAGLAGSCRSGRITHIDPAGFAGLPTHAHQIKAGTCKCPLDHFFAGGPGRWQEILRLFTSLLISHQQQYFSLRTNQPPATSQQYFSLRTNQHQPSATSQTNRV
jgi:hypothetical protein